MKNVKEAAFMWVAMPVLLLLSWIVFGNKTPMEVNDAIDR